MATSKKMAGVMNSLLCLRNQLAEAGLIQTVAARHRAALDNEKMWDALKELKWQLADAPKAGPDVKLESPQAGKFGQSPNLPAIVSAVVQRHAGLQEWLRLMYEGTQEKSTMTMEEMVQIAAASKEQYLTCLHFPEILEDCRTKLQETKLAHLLGVSPCL